MNSRIPTQNYCLLTSFITCHARNVKVNGNDESDVPFNKLNNSTIFWSGGNGDDQLFYTFTSAGLTSLTLKDDYDGNNDISLYCSDAVSCDLLSRKTFIANIHDPTNPESTVERINIEWDDNDMPTAQIKSVFVKLAANGNNEMHFDDTMAAMDVFGGDLDDSTYNNCSFGGSGVSPLHDPNSQQ